MTSRLVNIPHPPPEFSLEYIQRKIPDLESHLAKLAPRLEALESPDWSPSLLPIIPPFVRPTSPPPIDYSGGPTIPDPVNIEIPPELPSTAPVSEQRTRLEEIRELQRQADAIREERFSSMLACENFENWCREDQPRAFWAKVDAKERRHAEKVKKREEDNTKRVDEPVRIRTRYGKIASLLEDYKARVAEDVSRRDQVQCGIRALASLLDEVRHLHNLIRAVGYEDSLGEYLDLVMDVLHLDSPAHGMVYERFPSSTTGVIRLVPPHVAPSSSKKRSRDEYEAADPLVSRQPSGSGANRSFTHETFSAYLERHKGIKTTLKTLVGSSRIKRGRVSLAPFSCSFPANFLSRVANAATGTGRVSSWSPLRRGLRAIYACLV
jgi:hypothetical protein